MGHNEVFSTTGLTVNAIFNHSGNGQSVQGWVEKVVFTSTSWANGSVFITDRHGDLVFGAGAISGTLPRVFYPRKFVSDTAGVSLSGTNAGFYSHPYVIGPLNVSGLGLGSTTAGTQGRIDVYYYN